MLHINKLFKLSVFAFSIIFIFTACKKLDSPYFITYTMQNGTEWSSTKVDGLMQNDSLLFVGQNRKNNNSSITFFTNNNVPGKYNMAFADLNSFDLGALDLENVSIESLISINPTGSKDGKNNYVSISGILEITSHDSKKRVVEGTFDGKFIKGDNILSGQLYQIKGEFSAKYRKVGRFGI